MDVLKKSPKTSRRTPKTLLPGRLRGSQNCIYEFGAFRLDEKERLLFRSEKLVPLTPKVFDILLFLVQRKGSLVEKETLLTEIWPDAFVEEANLSVNIATLRKALGDGPSDHQYIETVPKRGYRFVAKVATREIKDDSSAAESLDIRRNWREQPSLPAAPKNFTSLAVLPFHNESKDPNAEYLSDGLTESIINSLSRLSGLRVVARNTVFRFRNTTLDLAQIAQELGVRSVVTGRILQLGDTVIIRTELIDPVNGWQLWGGQFHRKLSDVLAVQDEISEEISKGLEFQLTREERKQLTKHYTDNNDAYHLYLKGRYHWNTFSQSALRSAVDYLKQAIEIDPTYALAYAGLADCYYRLSSFYAPSREAMPKAKTAAMQALAIDPNLSEAHAALGLTKLFYELDWSGAERAFRRAIEINPNYSVAHQRLGLYFNLLGRFDEAEQELESARQIDPLSPHLSWSFALMFFLARDFEQALTEVQTTLEVDSNYVPTLYLLGRTYEQLGKLELALATFQKVLTLNDAPAFLAALAHASVMSGDAGAARKILDQLEERSKHRYVSAYAKAIIHVSLSEKYLAFSCLEQAYKDRCEMITWLKVDPHFDSISADPQFIDLLSRVGLLDDRPAGPAAGRENNHRRESHF
jgi:TolB-like protein/Tfp pilus assembly protein PilF